MATIKEIINEASRIGKMPRVTYRFRNEDFIRTGTVTVIKDNRNHSGVAVQFDNREWDDWFWDSDSDDKRKKYLRNLSIENS